MKITKFITAIAAMAAIFFSFEGNAQTWNIPPAGSTTATYIGTTNTTGSTDLIINAGGSGTAAERMRILGSGTNAGFVGIGATSPASILDIKSASPTLTLTSASTFPSHAIKFSSNGSATPFSISYATFSACGSGALHIQNPTVGTTSKGIHLMGGASGGIFFSSNNLYGYQCAGANVAVADYEFDGSLASKTVLISDNVSPILALPSGYTFAVKSNSYMAGNLAIGSSTIPTNAPSTGAYKFFLSGNANVNGNVVIGDASTFTASSPTTPFPNSYSSSNHSGYSLYVAGGILTEKVKVAVRTDNVNWSDFVFAKDYELSSLNEVESFIKKNKHLPEIPSSEEVYKNGIDLVQMDAKLLQKIEELTLYMIEMKKENETLKKDIEELKKK